MPILTSSYNPLLLFKNGHFSTIYSGKIRKVHGVEQERQTITTPDDDFLDIDWSYSKNKSNKLTVILHGLEGNAQRPYVTGSAKIFNKNNYDVASLNYRGCSGSQNKKFRSYHSGDSQELAWLVKYLIENFPYTEIVLKGFSLGANVILKYLGEEEVPNKIKAAIAVSAPCDLHGSMLEIHKTKNYLYALRFKKSLLQKLKHKQEQFPDKISNSDLKNIITLKDFDDFYTSQAHGFKNALDYYEKSSSLQVLESIKVPTLILNAANDSFLSKSCYPYKQAEENNSLFLEVPKYGGHVGFYDANNTYYNEKRAIEFLNSVF
ncbi:alpha/beta fold hydrolase [Galbibacter sp. BG1]|uniref:YheT family hydrolase n=1 Tax=Galbibacter sp. BG1 TaxID=1170699 RepID=UPI0015BC4AAA|nr:alpha/beta fold hydrolase [Galbibacter sp. BG1]QLE01350.1 alpha/beta fold hydrolase [Galbibacter sp. BG1]